MTEKQECEHLEQKFNVELERFVCIQCSEKFYDYKYNQGFLFGKKEGIRIGREEAKNNHCKTCGTAEKEYNIPCVCECHPRNAATKKFWLE